MARTELAYNKEKEKKDKRVSQQVALLLTFVILL
jgi:hypothetical protein